MKSVIVLGAGKIGNSIAKLLHHSGDYQVTLADSDGKRLQRIKESLAVFTRRLDVEDRSALDELFGRFTEGGIVV